MSTLNQVKLTPQELQLNQDIALFPQITPVKPGMHLTYKGVSRTVMLDRYAYKDVKRTTLRKGNLVVLTVKDHPKFPQKGYGTVIDIDHEKGLVTVELDPQFEEGATITVSINKVDKPLEIYYEQIADRIARGLAAVEETDEKKKEWTEKFYQELIQLNFVPAGRVLMGAGSNQGTTFFNCYVMPFIPDSRDGIGEHRKKVMEIMSRGGGVGTNSSTLRPRDAICVSVNGRSSGSVTWDHDLSELTNHVSQGGSRRGAQMVMKNSWHPDVIEFIVSKMQNPKVLRFIAEHTQTPLIKQEVERKLKFVPLTITERWAYELLAAKLPITPEEEKAVTEAQEILKEGGKYTVHNPDFLEGANISVCLTDDFMHAVEHNLDYELKFPHLEVYDEDMRKIYNEEWHLCGDVREWERRGYAVKTYHTLKAKELWQLINICATYSAEPGIFFIDNANSMTNAKAYGQQVVATNPCGKMLASR